MITWLAEIGDITRFGSVNKLLAYGGLDPSDQISAGKVTGTKTRKGNARLHGALRNAARAMLTHAPSCKFSMWARAYMGRHSRGGKSKAIHALARRIGKALYYCHLKNEPFDDSGYHALLSESSYPLCPVEEMGLSAGVVRILKGNGLRDVAAGRRRVLQRPGEATGMRKSHRSGGSDLDQQSQKPLPGQNPEVKGHRGVGEPASRGGLRLRGIVTRRSKRTLKEDLELVTYNVSSENGSHLVEDFAPPGGPYLSLGQEVDLEVVVRTFTDKNQQACSRLRIARMVGEF